MQLLSSIRNDEALNSYHGCRVSSLNADIRLGAFAHILKTAPDYPRVSAAFGLLRGVGATHVCNSTAPTFLDDLTTALSETGATVAFDAIGGGKLAGQILGCMESAAVKRMKTYSRYGSDTFKQVYIYGGLDTTPTTLNRSFGLSWALGGWLLTPFLQKIGREETQKLRSRVVAELKTTFASHYSHEVSLTEMLKPDVIAAYNKRATGEKYLVRPHLA